MSSGVPNGPYSGPVYSRKSEPANATQRVAARLMGSDNWEGTYLVFVQLA